MAITPKLITSSTALLAATMLAALVGTVWVVAEFAPGANLVQPKQLRVEPAPAPAVSQAPRAELDVPFSPDARPADSAWCADTADDLFEVFEGLANGEMVEVRTKVIAATVGDYIRANCPSAIHHGDWDTTAQILGVGVLYEVLEPQSHVYVDSLLWDPRADYLVDVAVGTFDVLAPEAMCAAALRQPEVGTNAFTPLLPTCHAAFR